MYQTIAPKQGVQGAWGVEAEGSTTHACTLEKPHTRSVCLCLGHYLKLLWGNHRDQTLKIGGKGAKKYVSPAALALAHTSPFFVFPRF